jgi:hypothetical protein
MPSMPFAANSSMTLYGLKHTHLGNIFLVVVAVPDASREKDGITTT